MMLRVIRTKAKAKQKKIKNIVKEMKEKWKNRKICKGAHTHGVKCIERTVTYIFSQLAIFKIKCIASHAEAAAAAMMRNSRWQSNNETYKENNGQRSEER